MKTVLFITAAFFAHESLGATVKVTYNDYLCLFHLSKTEISIEASGSGRNEKEKKMLTPGEQKELESILKKVESESARFDSKKCPREFIEYKSEKHTKQVCVDDEKAALFKLSQWLIHLF